MLRTKMIVVGLSAGLLATTVTTGPAEAGRFTASVKRAWNALVGKPAADARPTTSAAEGEGLRPASAPVAQPAARPAGVVEVPVVQPATFRPSWRSGPLDDGPAVRPKAPARRPDADDGPLLRPTADRGGRAARGVELDDAPRFAPRPIPPRYEVRTGGADAKAAPARTIVFFHGAGQMPENEVLKHLAGGLDANGVSSRIVSLPYEADRAALDRFLAEQPGQIYIAGHSMGGAAAMYAMQSHGARIKGAILINPAAGVRDLPVPTLLVRGTNDGFRADEGGKNVITVEARGGDHSLRYRLPGDHDKVRADKSPETRAMNAALGAEVKAFLELVE